MLVEAEGAAAVDPQRLERRPPAREALVVAAITALAGSTTPSPETPPRGAARSHPPAPARAPTASSGAPIARRSGAAFTSDSATSSAGSESQTIPPPTQRWSGRSAIGERADRERELEVAVAVDAAQSAHRGAAPDRLERRNEVDRRDLRGARDRAAGKSASSSSARPTSGRSVALDRRDEMLDARERLRGSSARASGRCRARRRARGRCARGRRS